MSNISWNDRRTHAIIFSLSITLASAIDVYDIALFLGASLSPSNPKIAAIKILTGPYRFHFKGSMSKQDMCLKRTDGP